jgi:anaerobic magnesium-protoporphyrin IX monomethyl ester cyclase
VRTLEGTDRAPATTPVPIRIGERVPPLDVVLVRGPVVLLPSSLASHGPTPPIGLAYLAAVLREHGHRVDMIDAPGAGFDEVVDVASPVGTVKRVGLSAAEIVERIPSGTTLVGFTLMFLHEWPQMREVIEAVRAALPDAYLVVGGETATSFWPWMLEQTDAIDLVALGEGEATILAVADELARGRRPRGLEGTVDPSETDGAPITNGLPTRLRQLSTIPEPAWDLVALDPYWSHPYFGVDRGRSMPVMATRGCPYKCSFCSSPQMWTTRYVVRDPEEVVDEIERHVRDRGVRNINFCDLTAITRRKWTLQFCDALDARNLDITWQLPVGTRAEALDDEVLRRLHATGCRNITYAPESGSPRMLEVYDKKVDLDHILTSLRAAHGIGLKTHVNIILGHPEERWSDTAKSVRFLWRAARAGCDDAAVILFCPYPGSRDFDTLLSEGKVVVDEATCYIALSRSSSAAQSFNEHHSIRGLRVLQLAMLAFFYASAMVLHPSRLWSFVRGQLTGDETTYLDQMIRTRRQIQRAPSAPTSPGPEAVATWARPAAGPGR